MEEEDSPWATEAAEDRKFVSAESAEIFIDSDNLEDLQLLFDIACF